MKKDTEYIISAAYWFKELNFSGYTAYDNIESGCVIAGLRHNHCIVNAVSMLNFPKKKKSDDSIESSIVILPAHLGEMVDGFITSKNRFVEREEAAEIALKAGQIEKLNYSKSKLYSEDLY